MAGGGNERHIAEQWRPGPEEVIQFENWAGFPDLRVGRTE